MEGLCEAKAVDLRTESEVMDDRESLKVSFLSESLGSLTFDKFPNVVCMSQRYKRGIPELKEASEQWIGGTLHSPLSKFYTNQMGC